MPDRIHATHCPVCRRSYTRDGDAMRTRDHIMPKVWGGSTCFYGAGLVDRQTRAMCQRCNSLRGSVGHCIGALACVLAAAETECVPATQIVRRWRLHEVRPTLGRRGMRAWIRRAGLAPRIAGVAPDA